MSDAKYKPTPYMPVFIGIYTKKSALDAVAVNICDAKEQAR